MRTILAGLLLCTAFAVGDGYAQSKSEQTGEPTAEAKELLDEMRRTLIRRH